MRRGRSIYQVEALDPRVVLSAVIAPIVPVNPIIPIVPVPLPSQVWGTIQGTYSTPSLSKISVDTGITENLSGTANLPMLGSVNVTGAIQGTGNIFNGQSTGFLTLSSSSGAVTLYLTGPSQGAFAPLPSTYQFSVESASGQFSQLSITGTIAFTQTPATHTFAMKLESVHFGDPGALLGTANGTYSNLSVHIGGGQSYHLGGSAAVGLLGQVDVEGTIKAVGAVVKGTATGTITLSNKSGQITLGLTGPLQSGLSPLPATFQYTITSSSGAYQGLTSSGQVRLSLSTSTPILSIPNNGQATPPIVLAGGKFYMTIVPSVSLPIISPGPIIEPFPIIGPRPVIEPILMNTSQDLQSS